MLRTLINATALTLIAGSLGLSSPAFACPGADAAAYKAAAERVKAAEGSKASFAVNGMHCGDCSDKVTAALKGVDGVTAAAVDYQTGRTEVAYDAKKVSPDALLKAIESTGYKAELAEKRT